MATIRQVIKSLIGIEDLQLGNDIQNQTRNGTSYPITSLSGESLPISTALGQSIKAYIDANIGGGGGGSSFIAALSQVEQGSGTQILPNTSTPINFGSLVYDDLSLWDANNAHLLSVPVGFVGKARWSCNVELVTGSLNPPTRVTIDLQQAPGFSYAGEASIELFNMQTLVRREIQLQTGIIEVTGGESKVVQLYHNSTDNMIMQNEGVWFTLELWS